MQFQGEKPIFLQLAEQLEDGILSGAYPEGSQVPSITEYAATYKINPATALKGINQLVNAGLLYKKRGIGMFVAEGAQENLRKQDVYKRQGKSYEEAVGPRWAMTTPIPEEAKSLVVLDALADRETIASSVDFIFCAVDMKKEEIRALEESYAKLERCV